MFIIHLLCGLLAYGIMFADFQGEYPFIAEENYRYHMGVSLLIGLIGRIIALIIVFFMSGFCKHGLKFW